MGEEGLETAEEFTPSARDAIRAEWARLSAESGVDQLVTRRERSAVSRRCHREAVEKQRRGLLVQGSEPLTKAGFSGVSGLAGGKGLKLGSSLESYVSILEWVAANRWLEVGVEEAPCALAWSLLRSVRKRKVVETMFWREFFSQVVGFLRNREGFGRSGERTVADKGEAERAYQDWLGKVESGVGGSADGD